MLNISSASEIPHTVIMKKGVTFSEPLITNIVTLPSIEDGGKPNSCCTEESINGSEVDSGNLSSWNLMSMNKSSRVSCVRLFSKDEKTDSDFQGHDSSSEDDRTGCDLCSNTSTDCRCCSAIPHRSFHDVSSSSAESTYGYSSQPKRTIMVYTSDSLSEAQALSSPKMRHSSSTGANKTRVEPAVLTKQGKRPIHQDQKLRAAAA